MIDARVNGAPPLATALGGSMPRRRLVAGARLALALAATQVLPACRQDSREAVIEGRLDRGELAASASHSRTTAITQAVARVAPAVVTVQTQVVERVARDIFEEFFGGRSGERSTAGIGSGFVARSDGIIVTNAHVVAGATRIVVMMRDGTSHQAELVGADETNDLAVIRIRASGLPVAPLGNSDDLLLGEWAIAIGNPYGFILGNPEPSVTTGVVSGVGRNLTARAEGASAYFDMIQTDASINPGNSGGPLVNATGEVVGVNSSIFSTTGGSIGLGFAIPINRVRRVVEDLLQHGVVRRAWVGVKVRVDPSADPRGIGAAGVTVELVTPGSPADQAGVRPGDLILEARGRPVRSPFDWEGRLLDLRVGEVLPVRLRRGNRDMDVRVTVADLPEATMPRVEVLREMQLVTLSPAIRAEREIQAPRGALVYAISDQLSDGLGLRRGDVLVQINRTPVASADEVARALDYYGGRGPIAVFFERGGELYRSDFQLR
jgi:serine protease Do